MDCLTLALLPDNLTRGDSISRIVPSGVDCPTLALPHDNLTGGDSIIRIVPGTPVTIFIVL